jgi:hypothetical protein
MDGAMRSSTSFISFKLEEIAKNLTSGRNKAYWFMFEPLLMSKDVFAKLPKAQQDIVMAVGAEQEKFATDAARADDKAAAEVYAKAGAKVYDLDEATVKKWQDIARDSNDLTKGFKDSEQLVAKDMNGVSTWDIILGDPANYVAPKDPHMIESVQPRAGLYLRGEIKFPRAQGMHVMTGKKDGSRLTVALGFHGKCTGGGSASCIPPTSRPSRSYASVTAVSTPR